MYFTHQTSQPISRTIQITIFDILALRKPCLPSDLFCQTLSSKTKSFMCFDLYLQIITNYSSTLDFTPIFSLLSSYTVHNSKTLEKSFSGVNLTPEVNLMYYYSLTF